MTQHRRSHGVVLLALAVLGTASVACARGRSVENPQSDPAPAPDAEAQADELETTLDSLLGDLDSDDNLSDLDSDLQDDPAPSPDAEAQGDELEAMLDSLLGDLNSDDNLSDLDSELP